MEKRSNNNGFISFLLVIIILILLGFGAIFSGLVKVNGPIIYIGNEPANKNEAESTKQSTTNTTSPKTTTPKTNSENSNLVSNALAEASDSSVSSNTTTTTNTSTTTKTSTPEAKPQKSSVGTEQILSYYEKKLSNYKNVQYGIEDINNDKIPELFIFQTGTVKNQIMAYTEVYTYDENQGSVKNDYIVYVGTIQGRLDTNTVLYKMNDGKLMSVYGHMGIETTATYALENDWLVRTDFSKEENEVKSGDYVEGDKEITFKNVTDKSLIKNYKD